MLNSMYATLLGSQVHTCTLQDLEQLLSAWRLSGWRPNVSTLALIVHRLSPPQQPQLDTWPPALPAAGHSSSEGHTHEAGSPGGHTWHPDLLHHLDQLSQHQGPPEYRLRAATCDTSARILNSLYHLKALTPVLAATAAHVAVKHSHEATPDALVLLLKVLYRTHCQHPQV
jgi:hypothetical protein